jgi:hydrophobic/amphiphilic exporter-1 (mainly G- bacteria), HAE1 family
VSDATRNESDANESGPNEPTPTATGGRGRLSSFATNRPVAVFVVFAAAAVFGWFSYGRLPVTLMPELSYPTLTVRTEFPGAAPEEVENDISRPVEEALGVVGGLQRISSISRADVSDVVLELTWDTEMSDATQDVLERLDLVFLPEEAKRPLILQYDPSLDPVMELSLSGAGERFQGEEGLRRLRRVAELQIKRALEPIKGVAAVRVRGGLEEEIHVYLDEEALRRTGLSTQDVILRLQQENINVAGGTIKEGRTEYMVRTLNEYASMGEIEDTVVASRDGRDIRIRDLGKVTFSHREREIVTRTDGKESVQVEILKEAEANMVALAKRVKLALGELDLEAEAKRAAGEEEVKKIPGMPEGFEMPVGLATALYRSEGVILQVVADRSLFIESSINEVRSTALMGGLLAVLVLFLFLRNAVTTAIISVAIPTSLIIAFAPLNVLEVTLNIMSLGGLALGIGMLVDSSIVVLESIYRCREEGDDVATAAVRGTAEVRGAVTASILTSIAVFFPMVFVEGVAGQAFGDLGLAVVVSLLASLAVALFLIPMLASRRGLGHAAKEQPVDFTLEALERFKGRLRQRHGVRRLLWLPFMLMALGASGFIELAWKFGLLILWASALVLRRFVVPIFAKIFGFVMAVPLKLTEKLLDGLRAAYPVVLRGALRSTGLVIALVAAVLAGSFWMVRQLDSELLPEVYQGEFTFELAMPVGTPLEETVSALNAVERAILEDQEYIDALLVTFGFDAATSQRSDEGEHSARFKVLVERPHPGLLARLLAPLTGRPPEELEVQAREEKVIARIREYLAEVPDVDARVTRPVLFSFRSPVEVEVHGENLRQLKSYGEDTRAALAALPQLTDVETTLKSGAPEVQIIYDRDRLARYGLNIRQVAQLVRDQVKGTEATRYNLHDRRVPVLVRLGEEDRGTVDDVRELTVNPGGERPIPLAAVAQVVLGEGPSEVRRVDGQRVALVTANLADASLGSAVGAIRQTLDQDIEWPSGMTYLVAGQNEEWQRSQRSLWLALALSIFLVYVIMAAQFESLLQPLVIMFSIPLAFVGTLFALWWLDISLSIVVFLGMILLAGIVVNNAIVLVDYINRLKQRGLPRVEAIVTAGSVRLRPILMTTATTVLGLAPMALGLGDGAEIRTPMAIAVITGLISSTALTLIVIPVLYALVDRLQEGLAGRRQGARDQAEAEAEALTGSDGSVGYEPTGVTS